MWVAAVLIGQWVIIQHVDTSLWSIDRTLFSPLHIYCLALYDPFGVDVPLNFDITHSTYAVDCSARTRQVHIKSPRIHLHAPPNLTCSRRYDHEWLKADYKPASPPLHIIILFPLVHVICSLKQREVLKWKVLISQGPLHITVTIVYTQRHDSHPVSQRCMYMYLQHSQMPYNSTVWCNDHKE